MEYEGKLYGKVGNKYFPTGKTSEDWDKLTEQLQEARALLDLYTPKLTATRHLNELEKRGRKFLERTK